MNSDVEKEGHKGFDFADFNVKMAIGFGLLLVVFLLMYIAFVK